MEPQKIPPFFCIYKTLGVHNLVFCEILTTLAVQKQELSELRENLAKLEENYYRFKGTIRNETRKKLKVIQTALDLPGFEGLYKK